MNKKVLIAYPAGTRAARLVAEAIADDLPLRADVRADDEVTDLTPYCALVLGTPRDRDSTLHPPKLVWIEPALQQALPAAVYGTEPHPLDSEERAASQAHLEHALTHMPWLYPLAVAIFSTAETGGDSPELFDREAIRAWAYDLPALLGLAVPVG
jgi:menaquinone-dependent protoporphyrinogen IX oxidase